MICVNQIENIRPIATNIMDWNEGMFTSDFDLGICPFLAVALKKEEKDRNLY
jgi:hypothetical protein